MHSRQPQPTSGRKQKWVLRVQNTQWALGVVMLVFGLLISTQFRVMSQKLSTDPNRLRAEDLANQLKSTEAKLQATETERDQLAQELDKLRKGQSDGLAPQDGLELLAGVTEVQGPGIRVTLTEDPEAGAKARIRDEDLWMVVNELLAAGAESISINGQRLTSLSGIRNVGERILIYQTMTASPYEIAAIGDAAVLEKSLRMRSGVVDTLGRFGIRVTIARNEKVRLPAFRSLPQFQYARPTPQ